MIGIEGIIGNVGNVGIVGVVGDFWLSMLMWVLMSGLWCVFSRNDNFI